MPLGRNMSAARSGGGLATLFGTGRSPPPLDALALLDHLVFNIVVSNTDAHAKTYSLLLRSAAVRDWLPSTMCHPSWPSGSL